MGWALVILIGLSIPADKKIRYVLPMAPALALICGYLFYDAHEQKYLAVLRRVFIWFCCCFPLFCLIGLLMIQHRLPEFHMAYIAWIIFLLVMQANMILASRSSFLVFALAVMVFAAIEIGVIEPINLHLNRTRSFVVEVENLRHSEGAQLIFYREHMDGFVIKYLISMPEEEQPIFIEDPKQLAKLTRSGFIISSVEHAKQIPRGISLLVVAHGKIGREPVVVFSKNVVHPVDEF